MVVVIDYDMGNVGSVLNILKKIGAKTLSTSCPDDLLQATRIVLPGVGSFDDGMNKLKRSGYLSLLHHCVMEKKVPILGICLGMQLFTKSSAEGQESGLGWFDAQAVRFAFEDPSHKVPHMGWNNVEISKESPFLFSHDDETRFYFVHSYHVQCNDPKDILASTTYGFKFTSAICRGNVLGTQFHPEKSHKFGVNFFKAFLNWTPGSHGRG